MADQSATLSTLTARAGAFLLCLLASVMTAQLGHPLFTLPFPTSGEATQVSGEVETISPRRGVYEPEDTVAPL